MSLTSYLAAPPRGGVFLVACERDTCVVGRRFGSGGDLLSHACWRSTIGAAALNDRVRNGLGCFARAVATRPETRPVLLVSLIGFRGLDAVRGPAVAGPDQAFRAIRTGSLSALPRVHVRPIDVVVFHGPLGRPCFEVGFPLRCLQRLSVPDMATLLRGWRHDRSTSGPSIPVLSYWGQRLSGLRHPRQIGTELSHDVLNPAHVPL